MQHDLQTTRESATLDRGLFHASSASTDEGAPGPLAHELLGQPTRYEPLRAVVGLPGESPKPNPPVEIPSDAVAQLRFVD
jgi:hypothetical protein